MPCMIFHISEFENPVFMATVKAFLGMQFTPHKNEMPAFFLVHSLDSYNQRIVLTKIIGLYRLLSGPYENPF